MNTGAASARPRNFRPAVVLEVRIPPDRRRARHPTASGGLMTNRKRLLPSRWRQPPPSLPASSRSRRRRRPRVTISPLPGTPTALPQTQISFLGASASALSAISVVGSSSGRHSGRLRSYASATGASFLPSRPFTPGEHVTVHAPKAPKGARRTLSSSFTIEQPGVVAQTEFAPIPGTPADVQSFQSRADLHPGVGHRSSGAGRRQRSRPAVCGAVSRPGPVRTDDLRQRRQPGVVPSAAARARTPLTSARRSTAARPT